MKCHALLLAAVLALPSAVASTPPATLPAWDQLSPAQREIVIAPIRDRWNASPETRARMYGHAQRWQQLTPQQRIRARRGMWKWERMDPEQRDAVRTLFHKMRGMTPEQRHALRDQWHAMTPQQRRDWVRSNLAPDD